MPDPALTLQEQLLLLCLNDETGRYDCPYVHYGLAGAALLELLRSGRATLDGEMVHPADCSTTGDEVLDVAVARLKTARRAHSLKHWARFIYRHPSIPVEVLTARLILRDILTEEEGRILWIFPTLRYPTADPAPEQGIRERLRAALLEGGAPDLVGTTLVPLLHGCRALRPLFTKEEWNDRQARLEELLAADPVAAPVGEAITAVVGDDEAAAAASTILVASAAA